MTPKQMDDPVVVENAYLSSCSSASKRPIPASFAFWEKISRVSICRSLPNCACISASCSSRRHSTIR